MTPDPGILLFVPIGMALLPLCYGDSDTARRTRWKRTLQVVLWIAASTWLLLRLLDASVQQRGWPWTAVAIQFCFVCYLAPVMTVVGIFVKAVAGTFE